MDQHGGQTAPEGVVPSAPPPEEDIHRTPDPSSPGQEAGPMDPLAAAGDSSEQPELQRPPLPPGIPVILIHSVDGRFLHQPRAIVVDRHYADGPYRHPLTFPAVFEDKAVRQAFIRKVYFILTCLLILTFGIVCLFTFHEPTKQLVQRNRFLLWVSLGVMFGTMIVMSCFPTVRRRFPINILFLLVFVAAKSFMLGTIAAMFEAEAVLMAIGSTAAVCLGLTIFALQTKWDFTAPRGAMSAGLTVLLVFGLVVILLPSRVLLLVYASLGTFIFSLHLVADTQRIIGGSHRYSICPDEYIFATLTLYLDVVNIFIFLLMLIRLVRR